MEPGIIPFLFLLALVPGVIWLYYFYRKDKYEPEPLSWIILIYLLGIMVTFPVAFIEGMIGLFVPEILIAVIAAPVIEEAAKFLMVKWTVYRSREFDEPVDGIMYAAAAGLGFATLENVIYVFAAYEVSFPFALETAVARALISVPGHVLFSSTWGYALGQARFLPPEYRPGLIVRGLVVAMASHALFNLLLVFDYPGFALGVLIVIPLMWWWLHKRIDSSLLQSVYRKGRE